MNYLHYTFDAKQGDTIKIDVDHNANVMLLTPENYTKYSEREKFSYYGGHAKKSPVHIEVPYSGIWNVVINLGGFPGKLKAAVELIPLEEELALSN